MTLDVSARQRRIDDQCRCAYLHINSGVHYAITNKTNSVYQLDPICGASKYATEEQLANAAIWRKC
jgi:hypothetical protein